MSENKKLPTELPVLHPSYEVAEKDSRLLIQFVGNTATVGSWSMDKVTPFMLLAASKFLERTAYIMLGEQEEQHRIAMQQQAALGKIQVPDNPNFIKDIKGQ